MKIRKEPTRTCVGCGISKPKRELIRVVRTPDGGVLVDESGKKPGRGAYICPSSECYARAVKCRRLHRALGGEPAPGLAELIEKLSGKG